MSTEEIWKLIQANVGVTADGNPGPKTAQAIADKLGIDTSQNIVKASSFADPKDVEAFRRCKAAGGTDQECYKVGDSGIGFQGMDCADPSRAICALPPEDWKPKWGSAANANGKPVLVTYRGKQVLGVIGDTMPHKANIANGAGIDLNPGFAREFGVSPPFMLEGVTWQWAE